MTGSGPVTADQYVYVLTFRGVAIAAAPENKGLEVLNEHMSLFTPQQQLDMTIRKVKVYR